MSVSLCCLSIIIAIAYSQEKCGSPNDGSVAKGVDFVDLWSRYEATKQVPKPEMGTLQYAARDI